MSHHRPHKSRRICSFSSVSALCIYILGIYSFGSRLISVYPVTYLLRHLTSRPCSLSSPHLSYIVHSSLIYPIPFLFCLTSLHIYLGLWNPTPTGQCGCPLLDHCFIPLWSDPCPIAQTARQSSWSTPLLSLQSRSFSLKPYCVFCLIASQREQ